MRGLSRRDFLKLSAAAAGAVAAPGILLPRAAEAALPKCMWGAFPDPSPGCETSSGGCGPEDLMPAVYSFESLIGRTLKMTRHYPNWDYPIPNPVIKESTRTGHIPLIAWRAQKVDNTWIKWADIASGVHDAEINAKAAAIHNWNRRAYFVFHHEPENAFKRGIETSAADFQNAYRHIRGIFDSYGITKLTYICTLQRVTYDGSSGGPSAWIPLDVVNLIGVDGYNRGACASDHLWKSFPSLFTTARNHARQIGKNLVIQEWGAVEPSACGGTSTQTKGDWIREAGTTIKSWPEVKAVMYTHSLAEFKGVPVDFRITSSTDALNAYKEVGADLWFN